MNNDSSLFFGGGGFGGINKARVMKTVFVPISNPIQPKNTITEQVYKEPITRKRAVRKTDSKRKKVTKKSPKKQQQSKKQQAKKNKIDKFPNF